MIRQPDQDNGTKSQFDAGALCQSCGACCAYDASWPRFTLEDDAVLALIPREHVNAADTGMAWTGSRCSALKGEIGQHTACTVYGVRPLVCRDCLPGDDACAMARERHGMARLSTMDFTT
jgi:hypothetical protein